MCAVQETWDQWKAAEKEGGTAVMTVRKCFLLPHVKFKLLQFLH